MKRQSPRPSKPPSPELEPLWGERPISVTPVTEKWGIGRVVPSDPAELSPNPRWGIWNLRTGKLAFGLSGTLAVALSHDEKQIAVWREHIGAQTTDRPFFGGKARTDFRWSFERRRWPGHDRVISYIEDLGTDLIRSWPISIEFSRDDRFVILTCNSEKGSAQIFVECNSRAGDRIVDALPRESMPPPRRPAKPKPKPKPKPNPKPKTKAKPKPKTKAKPKPKSKPQAKPKKSKSRRSRAR